MKIDTKKVIILMAEQGLSQMGLATSIGTTQYTVWRVLNRGTCRPATAGKIAKGLGVHVTEIIKEEE